MANSINACRNYIKNTPGLDPEKYGFKTCSSNNDVKKAAQEMIKGFLGMEYMKTMFPGMLDSGPNMSSFFSERRLTQPEQLTIKGNSFGYRVRPPGQVVTDLFNNVSKGCGYSPQHGTYFYPGNGSKFGSKSRRRRKSRGFTKRSNKGSKRSKKRSKRRTKKSRKSKRRTKKSRKSKSRTKKSKKSRKLKNR